MKKSLLLTGFLFLTACSQINSNTCHQYHGILPGADNSGIEVTLTLNSDGTFQRKLHYLGKKNDFIENGSYNIQNNQLLTIAQGDTIYYTIEHNALRQLNGEKEKIKGSLSRHYILKCIK